MGKDREGSFHPSKGRPSEDKGQITELKSGGDLEQYQELAEKYTEGPEEQPASGTIRHPNRNVNKGERTRVRSKRKKQNKSQDEAAPAIQPEELPAFLTKEIFQEIATYQSDLCVTIYFPTQRDGREINSQSNQILYKNGLQAAAASMRSRGIDEVEIEHILQPGYQLLEDGQLWNEMREGFGAFLAKGFCRYIKMPVAPKEEQLLDITFFITPLVPIMTNADYFYLLVISKKQCKLFRADEFGMTYMPISELPDGVTDVGSMEQEEDAKLFRTESRQAGKGASFHGQGAGKNDNKAHIAIYLEEVDDTLWDEVLHNENVPLLLAGVEYLIPIYKQVSDYNNIWPEAITGNHEHDDVNQLYARAKEIMTPYFEEKINKAFTQYQNQSATELTSSYEEQIIPAAYYSRISHLFAVKDEHIWGKFDEMNNKLTLSDMQGEGDECQLDKAVERTLLNGGQVFLLPKDKMPGDGKLAALFRY